MAITTSINPAKLKALRDRQRAGRSVSYAECLRVQWNRGRETAHYAISRFDQAPNYALLPAAWRPLQFRLVPRFSGTALEVLPFNSSFDIGDDSISLQFIDHDLLISNLFERFPEGAKVEVLGYIAEVDLELPPLWWGLLNPPSEAVDGVLSTSATFGYRSSQGKLPRRYLSSTKCQAIYPPSRPTMTLAQIARNDCPVDKHKGGSIGAVDPATGEVYASCPKNSREVCAQRTNLPADRLPFLAFDVILGSETVGSGKNSTTAKTKGNDGLLNTIAPVAFGEGRATDLPCLTLQIQRNKKHPEKGTVSCGFPLSDSHVQSITAPKINDVPVTNTPGTSQNQFLYSLGSRQQAPINLTGTLKMRNYSGVAHWRGLIFGDFSGRGAADFKGSCDFIGNDEIYLWTGANAGSYGYSNNRAEVLYWILTNYRAGDGESGDIYVGDDWEELAARCNDAVGYSDAAGEHYTGTRSTFNGLLAGGQTQDVIRQICLAGQFTIPFQFEGKKRIFLLRDEDVSGAPVFTDEGDSPNILPGASGFPSVAVSKTPIYQQINQVIAFYLDKDLDFIRRPQVFDYERLQEQRGAALNDSSQQILTKEWDLLGVNNQGEAVRVGNLLGDVGEFHSGGVRNPQKIRFSVRALDADVLTLHVYKIIRVVSRWTAHLRETDASGQNTGNPIRYWRILSIRRNPNLTVELNCVAYNKSYLEQLEDANQPPPRLGSGGTGALPDTEIAG